MPKSLSIVLLLSALIYTSCNNEEAPEGTNREVPVHAQSFDFQTLHWLKGRWEQNTSKGILFEEWAETSNGGLTAVSGYIEHADTTVEETILLEVRDKDIYYIPTVADQNDGLPVPFKLIEQAGDSVVFSNPGHDFPDRITYRKISDQKMIASISGKIEGASRSLQFEFTRTN